MDYRYEIASTAGLVQYLAANLLPSGYWFYVTGQIPDGKSPKPIDAKLIEKYGAGISRQARCRRKAVGVASVRYVRCGRFFILLATHGIHAFFQEEGTLVRDLRRVPLVVGHYSISYKPGAYRRRTPGRPPVRDDRWHPRVRITRGCYAHLKRAFLQIATHRSVEQLGRAFYGLPFEPYAPVRQQLLNLLRLVNKARHAAGLEKVPASVIRCQRRIFTPLAAHATVDGEGAA
jgi:hypothetical protein